MIGVAGLSKQLTEQVNCLRAGSFKSLAGQPGIRLGDAAVVVPFAQGAVVDQLVKIAKATGKTISVNSALRTLAQQVDEEDEDNTCLKLSITRCDLSSFDIVMINPFTVKKQTLKASYVSVTTKKRYLYFTFFAP